MKKILLSCMVATFSLQGLAQSSNPIYSLASIESSDEYEYETFSYNSDNLVTAIEKIYVGDLSVIDSLTYDEMNNVIRVDAYQLLDDGWKHVYYVDYTYDENNNRISRTNYNSFGGSEFYIGGVYHYFYENNVRTGWELHMGGSMLEKATLTYDEEGRLLEELVQNEWGSQLENSWRLVFNYNEDGTLAERQQDYWGVNSWNTSSTDLFYYDDLGNCIEWVSKNGNTIYDRYEYEYDLDYTVDQVVYPYHPESDVSISSLVEKNNKLTLSHWYTQNDAGELVYVCDYMYYYNFIGDLGVQDPIASYSDLMVYPNPATDWVTFSAGELTIKSLDILTTTGQLVLRKSNLNQREMSLDVSSLNAGVYFARIHTSKGVVTKKVMVK